MNIMIYIEPLIEIGTPLAKGYWVRHWVPRLCTVLRAATFERTTITLAAGATFLAGSAIDGVRLIPINPLDLVDPWKQDADQVLEDALRWPTSPMARRLSNKIRSFLPSEHFDLVIVIGTQGYHRNIFPSSPILYHEFSFSKKPGPESWYFDPTGPGGSAWLDRYWPTISRDYNPCHSHLKLAEEFMARYRNYVLQNSTLSTEVSDFTSKFEQNVMLPLQLDGVSSFSALSPISSQFNLVFGMRNRLPTRMGLVVTEHPRPIRGLTDEARMYFNSLGNVLIPVPAGSELGPSDVVAPHIDAIATVSSTVGALSILWSKPLISLSGQYMKGFADGVGPPPWELPKRDAKKDAKIMAFLMTRWMITAGQLEDGAWMRSFIYHVLKYARSKPTSIFPPFPLWEVPFSALEETWLRGL